MQDFTDTFADASSAHLQRGVWARWRRAWQTSLRFRLMVMGLAPVLVAFPLVLAVLLAVGGERAESLVRANLRTSLAGAASYLQQAKADAGVRVAQLAKSERLLHQLSQAGSSAALNEALRTSAEGSGLDFLLVARSNGRVIGSSSGVEPGRQLPDSFVVHQARIGVANVAFERFDASQLSAFSREFAADARVEAEPAAGQDGAPQRSGLLINAAAHFPLAVDAPDVVLVGGILVSRNFTLIDHMRELLFPVGSLPGDVEGLTAIHLDGVSIATSRQRMQGHGRIGRTAPPEAVAAVLHQGSTWIGEQTIDGQSHIVGYTALMDGNGQRIGMLAAGFPDAPYRRGVWLLMGVIGAVMALTMLATSLFFLHGGRDLTQRLAQIVDAMTAVRRGQRQARVAPGARADELGRLGRHFNDLLETLAQQDATQRAAQQTLADEASRRRALFEHERDGVLILNTDGTVFEANPKGAAMLGYNAAEVLRLRVSEWETQLDATRMLALLEQAGPGGCFLETVHRRKDGSHYPAEVSLSRATWGDKAFIFLLMRDITERKAVDAELARHRQDLEQRVEQRTKELNDRTEQLNAIFSLSPDGLVSFDRQQCVAFANQAFLRMTGLDADAVIGLDEAAFSERLADLSAVHAPFPGVGPLRTAADPHRAEPDWRQRFELARPRPRVLEVGLRLSEADSVSQVLYMRDVTHETEVDRMKSEFLTTAAHELRTPMTSIYGFANLLRMRKTMEAGPRAEILDTIAQQSELMITILNQLLDLARIEARQGQDFELQRLPLHQLVAATVAGYSPPAGRQPPVVSGFDAGLSIHADATKMHQAVLNVVSNAYKYSPAGGPVWITGRRDDSPGQRRVGIEVRDQGIGMTEEQLSHIGERFYRADASGAIPGTGLGMAIVHEIVQLHRGQLELTSRHGQGTTITLWLPLD